MGIPIYGHLMSFIIKEKNDDQPVDFGIFVTESGPDDKEDPAATLSALTRIHARLS
jgi:hypothetical protein